MAKVRVITNDEVIELAGQYLDSGNVEKMWETLVNGSVEADGTYEELKDQLINEKNERR